MQLATCVARLVLVLVSFGSGLLLDGPLERFSRGAMQREMLFVVVSTYELPTSLNQPSHLGEWKSAIRDACWETVTI